MNIILTIKAVLNYLYNHLIDLINVRKIVFADGTEQSTASSSASLFDIKVMSQAIADKGWAFMCHTTRRDLPKSLVPTLYDDIKYKYNHCDKEFISSSSIPTTNNGVWYCSTTNKYYWCDYTGHIYSSENIDLSNPTDLGDFGIGYYGSIFVGKNINLAHNANYGANCINVYNKNWELIKTINDVYNFLPEKFRLVNGYFVFWYSAGNQVFVTRITDDNNADYLQSENLYNYQYHLMVRGIFKCSDVYNGKVYLTTESDGGWVSFLKLNIDSLYVVQEFNQYTDFGRPVNNSGRVSITPIVIYNDEFYIANNNKIYKSSNTNLTNWTEVTTLSTNTQFLDIVEHNDTFYIATNGYIYTTNNFVSFNQLTSFTADTYGFQKLFNFYVDNDNILLSTGDSVLYVYGGMVKKIYTDTYTINGNPVVISYYKYNDFKICLSDGGTNDSNLETVFNENGWLPYWLLNTTNETVCVQRDFHTFAVMYVGDNFIDDLEDLSTDDYTGLAFYGEVLEYVDDKINQLPITPKTCITNYALNHLTSKTKDTVYQASKDTLVIIGRDSLSNDYSWTLQVSTDQNNWITIAQYGVANGDPRSNTIQSVVIEKGMYFKATGSGINVYMASSLYD